jgi:hypothetical protein
MYVQQLQIIGRGHYFLTLELKANWDWMQGGTSHLPSPLFLLDQVVNSLTDLDMSPADCGVILDHQRTDVDKYLSYAGLLDRAALVTYFKDGMGPLTLDKLPVQADASKAFTVIMPEYHLTITEEGRFVGLRHIYFHNGY